MKTLFFTLIFLFSLTEIQAQWKMTNINSGRNLEKVFLPSEDVIYIVTTDGPIIRSTDGGANWDSLFTLSLSSVNFSAKNNIWFVNDSTGYVSTKGRLYKTRTMGNSWTDITPDTNIHTITSLQFTSKLRGYFYSYKFSEGDLWTTNDGGQTWSKTEIEYPSGSGTPYLPAFTFADDSVGYFAGGDGSFMYRGVIIKTINGGKTWDTLTTFGQYSLIKATYFPADNDTGYVITTSFGDISTFYKTTDGGNTWDSVTTISSMDGIFFKNNKTAYSSFGSGISSSNDGGETWSVEFSTKKRINLTSFHCAGNLCYAVGDSGNVAVLDLTTSAADGYTSGTEIAVYPNPSAGVFNFSLPSNEEADLQLFNCTGELVESIKAKGSITVDLSNYPAGVFIYRVLTEGTATQGKILKR